MNRKYLFINLIGCMPDEDENANKINGYYQTTNGILIQDFALNLLNMKNDQVNIYAFGNDFNYDQYIHTNNKYYHQFDLCNVFQMNAKSSGLDFQYFIDFHGAFNDIDRIINNDKYISIVLFLNDHGSSEKFSKIDYLILYKILLKYPEKSFLIFNDSCFGGCLINLIEAYNKIYEMKIKNEMTDENLCRIVFSFSNLLHKILIETKHRNKIKNKVYNIINLIQENVIPV